MNNYKEDLLNLVAKIIKNSNKQNNKVEEWSNKFKD